MAKRRLLPWTIAASLLLHGVAYASLAAAPPKKQVERKKTELRFDVVGRSKPPPEPVAPLPDPPSPEPKAARRPAVKPAPPAPPAEPVPEPAPSPGVTLAGEGTGNAFSMPLGTGGSLQPTRAPAAALLLPVPVRPSAPPVAPVDAPKLVAVGDLSSKPTPPALGPALERNYPADARRRGLSGTAKVRARIDPDGVVRRVSLVEESGAGFGAACSRTLTGSRWAAPKDKAGRSVATEIRYTCRFVVEP